MVGRWHRSVLSLIAAFSTRKANLRLLGFLGALFGLTLLATGCLPNDRASTEDDRPKKVGVSETQHAPNSVKPREHNQHAADSKGESPTARNAAPKRSRLRSIPGMDPNEVLTILQKPGMECWQPTSNSVIYDCSTEENHHLPLLYEGTVRGSANGRVSGVEARVFRQEAENLEVASRSFFGFLATQLGYRGADREQAYGFVNRDLSEGQTSATIGKAKWTLAARADSKVLTIAPA